MSDEDVKALEIDGCEDVPPAPRTLTFTGNGDAHLLKVWLKDPGWGALRSLLRRMNYAMAHPESGEDPDALAAIALIEKWDKDYPVTQENLFNLDINIQNAIFEAARDIIDIRQAQVKNSRAPSASNG